jgi:hypothetical protein
MTTTFTADVYEDDVAVSLARAVAVANKRARESGIDILQSLITVTQRLFNGDVLWQINYGPRDYVSRRGGDLIIEIDSGDSSIKQVLWGQ